MNDRYRKYLLTTIVVCAALVTCIIAMSFYFNNYLPLREAEPIIEKLTSGNYDQIRAGLLQLRGYTGKYEGRNFQLTPISNHRPLRGPGEKKVKNLLLHMLSTTPDRNILDGILFMCASSEGLDLVNDGDEAKKIVVDAIKRFNDPNAHGGYTLIQQEDGRWRVAHFARRFKDSRGLQCGQGSSIRGGCQETNDISVQNKFLK